MSRQSAHVGYQPSLETSVHLINASRAAAIDRSDLFDPVHDVRPVYVRRREAARILGLAEGTLANQAAQKRGPAFHRIGRTVLYDVNELRRYVDAGRVEMASAA